jgi:hypothetical protein
MADLIQADDHVVGGVKPRHARSLVGFDLDAAFIGFVRAQLLDKVGMDRRSERRIDGGEGASSIRRREADVFGVQLEVRSGAVKNFDAVGR